MANPIKTSDLYQNTGELKQLLSELELIQKKFAELKDERVAAAAAIEAAVKKTSVASSQGRSEVEESAKSTDKLKQQVAKYNESLSDNAVKIAGVKNAIRQMNTVNKNEAKLIASKAGSYDALSAQYSLNKIRLNQMSAEERKATKTGQELENETRLIFEEMKRLQEATGKYVLNVGNYSSAIGGAAKKQKSLYEELEETRKEFKLLQAATGAGDEELKAYQQRITSLTEEVDGLSAVTGKTADDLGGGGGGLLDALSSSEGAAGQAAKGVKGLGTSLKALLANPVVLVLSVLAGVLVTLFSAFSRSEKGANLLATATGVANAVLSQLTEIAVSGVEVVEALFADPIGSLKEFGQLLVTNILNRFKAVPLIAKAAGDAITSLFSGDLEGLKKAGEDAFTAVKQAVSGLDAEQQTDLADAIKETTADIIAETKAFVDLELAKRAVRKSNRDLVRSIEALMTSEQLARSIADDTTKSFKEREQAAEDARASLEARASREIQVARNNLRLLNTEISLRRSNGEEVEALLDQQLGAYRELAGAEREFTLAVRDNERTRAELKQDRLERDLDILIDGFDNQKTINERLLNDDRLTFERRAEILRQTNQLSEDSFAKQIATIQKFTGVQVDANELIAESDAVVLNEKIRGLGLSEILEGRLLEIVRDRKSANQELSQSESDLAKSSRDSRLKIFEQEQEIAGIEFNALQTNEAQKAEFTIQQKRDQLEKIQQLNEQFGDITPTIDTAKLEAELAALDVVLAKARIDSGLEAFDQQEQLAQSEFDLLQRSEKKKTAFRLKAERDRLQKIIDLNAKFGGTLSEQQLSIMKNQISKIDGELQKDEGSFTDIFDAFGINLNDEQLAGIQSSFAFAKQQIIDLANTRVEAARRSKSAADSQVAEAQRALQTEVDLAASGAASRTETARAELERQKAIQKKAEEEQERAEKRQRQLQTIQQTTNLITASAKIFGQIGNPLIAIPLIALMFGSFAKAKIDAAKAAKNQQFGGGGTDVFQGSGSHATGDHIAFGSSKGKTFVAEAKERWAIFNKKAGQKYGGVLPEIINLINRNQFEDVFQRINGQAESGGVAFTAPSVNVSQSVDMNKSENYLSAIATNTSTFETTDSKGRRVVVSGLERKTYMN